MNEARSLDRRDFLCVVAGCVAATTGSCADVTHTPFFRERLRELTKAELADIVAGMAEDYHARYGKRFEVGAAPAQPGVEFAYALDLSHCVGCRRCVHACVAENNQSRDPEVQWIRVLEVEKGEGLDLAHADPYYDAALVPRAGYTYVPIACQQCRNPPCVKTCPTGATWQEPDGITVIDYDWCIGCRCCISACPYGARHFNWAEPQIPADELNTTTHVLGNRLREKGVVEKCTFCIHRVREGLYPACVEACPTGSRKFGNLLDPSSEIRYVLEHKRAFVLEAELGTRPRFYYFYGD